MQESLGGDGGIIRATSQTKIIAQNAANGGAARTTEQRSGPGVLFLDEKDIQKIARVELSISLPVG